MTQEQRRSRRYPVEVAAEVDVGDGRTLFASAQDISSGGVGLVLDRQLPEGSTVKVQLLLTQDGIEDPHEEPFESAGQVAWVANRESGFAAGIRFAAISAAQAQQLNRFLAAMAEVRPASPQSA